MSNRWPWESNRASDRWQEDAAVRALQLDRQIDFDVVHHVTPASYWTRAGVSVVKKPLIWGPIGGGVGPPMRLIPELGPRGMLEAVARWSGDPSPRCFRPSERPNEQPLSFSPRTRKRGGGSAAPGG